MPISQTNLAWDVLLDLPLWRGPLHERLAWALRAAIRAGRLPLASALPPSRALAADLRVSRWAVTQAYSQLISEGYLEARVGSATRVRWRPEADAPQPAVPGPVTAPARFDLTPGRPDLRGFPLSRWAEAVRAATATLPFDQLGYPEPEGSDQLRTVLADYLSRVRGATASAASVTICLRAVDGMMRSCSALLADGVTHLAVEEPSWPLLRSTASAAGLALVPLPVDFDGLRVDLLAAHPEVRAVCVSATHQFPTGAVLGPGRRASLLEWARRRDGLIIEDDYDAEFRYDRPAVATLQGMAPDRVFLLGSVSKTLAPAVSVGWVVSPHRMTPAIRAASPFPLVPSQIHQLALAWFIETGGYDRYLRSARQRYRTRRAVLQEALARLLPDCQVEGAAAGLHLVLRLPPGNNASVISKSAARRGVLVADLDRFRILPDPAHPALVLGYGNLADSAVDAAVSVLTEIISA
jgi:GntR family transcriptional regulator/MocR family aminotransferase